MRLFLLWLLVPLSAHGFRLYESGDRHFDFGGYVQPSFRVVEDGCAHTPAAPPPAPCATTVVPNGFSLTRARLKFSGAHSDRVSYKLLVRTVPNVELLGARLDFRLVDELVLTAGRFKVPFSHQELLAISRLQLPSRPAFARSAPGRQLGVALGYTTNLWLDALPKADPAERVKLARLRSPLWSERWKVRGAAE